MLDGEFQQFTPNTPTPENLAKRLASTRLSGIATSRGEYSRVRGDRGGRVLQRGAGLLADGGGPDTRCGPMAVAHLPGAQAVSEALGADLEATRGSDCQGLRPPG